MSSEQYVRNYFKFQPDRDDVLERIYAFLSAVSENKYEEANALVISDVSINNFYRSLNQHILNYATLYFEDHEIESDSDSFTKMLDKPSIMKEEDILPVFSGNSLLLNTGEIISVRIGIKGYITNIRIYFLLEEHDAVYYLRVKNIIKEDN